MEEVYYDTGGTSQNTALLHRMIYYVYVQVVYYP